MVKVNVYLGAHDMFASSEPYRVMYTCTNLIKYPNWITDSAHNNIGLIQLPETVHFSGKLF